MTVDQMLKAALDTVGLPVELGVYTGSGAAYITFNFNIIPAQCCDDVPLFGRAITQVHLFCPLQTDFTGYQKKILSALESAGFTPPEIVDASDADGRHYVYETETITKWRE